MLYRNHSKAVMCLVPESEQPLRRLYLDGSQTDTRDRNYWGRGDGEIVLIAPCWKHYRSGQDRNPVLDRTGQELKMKIMGFAST